MLIGITMGDACGLGPEILLRSVASNSLPQPFVLFGDLEVLEFALGKLNLNLDFHPVTSLEDIKPEHLNVFDCRQLQRTEVTIGKISAKAGAAAVNYVQVATEHALEEKIDAIVTLPINKAACRHTFPNFQGHTELIADMCGVNDYVLSLVAETDCHACFYPRFVEGSGNPRESRACAFSASNDSRSRWKAISPCEDCCRRT